MEPINYMAMMPQQNFLQNFNQGLQTAAMLGQLDEQSKAREQQTKAKEDLVNFFNKPNKTSQDYTLMMATYPALKDVLSDSYKTATDEKKQNDFNIAAQISGALHNGNNDLAKNILTKEKEAYLNSGDTKSAGGLDNILNTIDANPKGALDMSNMFMASIYPDKFNEVYKGITETNIAQQKAPLEVSKIISEINKTNSGISLDNAQKNQIAVNIKKAYADINKTNAETNNVLQESALKLADFKQKINSGEFESVKLSAGSEKELNDSVISATNNKSLANQYSNLSDKFAQTAEQYGKFGQGKELVKSFMGNQDEITRIKKEYERLKSSTIISMLPPGSASDRDIQIFSAPFPDSNADPKYLSDFLKSMSNLQNYEAKTNEAKAEWITKNGNLGSAKKDTTIVGGNVNKGQTFNDFISKNLVVPNDTELGNKKTETAAQTNQPLLQTNIPKVDLSTKGYMQKYGGGK